MSHLSTIPLNYAKRSEGVVGARLRRAGIGVVIVLMAIAVFRGGPDALRRVQIYRWQEQSASYTAPADQVVLLANDQPTERQHRGAIRLRLHQSVTSDPYTL